MQSSIDPGIYTSTYVPRRTYFDMLNYPYIQKLYLLVTFLLTPLFIWNADIMWVIIFTQGTRNAPSSSSTTPSSATKEE